jgi:methionyl aminopeptidase
MIKIKTQEQIDKIRESCQLAARSLEYIKPFVQPGVTTGELDDKIDRFIRDHNGIPASLNYMGFPKNTCISINEVVCHGIPGEQKIKGGDILNIDVATILDDHFGDTGKMFLVGDVPDNARRLCEIAKEALEIGINQVFPDNRLGNIGFNIATYVFSKNLSVVHDFCGHGVGSSLHEAPQVPHVAKKDTGPHMRPGMVFTIEPMINEGSPEVIIDERDKWTVRTPDGLLSAQYEHTILVTEDGHEVLTEI